jgi:hypothetical protein
MMKSKGYFNGEHKISHKKTLLRAYLLLINVLKKYLSILNALKAFYCILLMFFRTLIKPCAKSNIAFH